MEKNNLNRISKHWQNITPSHLTQLKKHGYQNHRRTVAYKYMTDETDHWHYYPDTIEGITKYYETVKDYIDLNISDTLDGNPVYITVDNKIVTQDLLTSLHELKFIESYIDFNSIKTIVEIGCGYGRSAYAILKKYPHIEYTIVDIEPAINISKQYLSSNFPKNKINFYTPSEFVYSNNLYDLAISISVLCELDIDQANAYLKAINEKCNFFYYKDRRYRDSVSQEYNWSILKPNDISKSLNFTRNMKQNLFKIK